METIRKKPLLTQIRYCFHFPVLVRRKKSMKCNGKMLKIQETHTKWQAYRVSELLYTESKMIYINIYSTEQSENRARESDQKEKPKRSHFPSKLEKKLLNKVCQGHFSMLLWLKGFSLDRVDSTLDALNDYTEHYNRKTLMWIIFSSFSRIFLFFAPPLLLVSNRSLMATLFNLFICFVMTKKIRVKKLMIN